MKQPSRLRLASRLRAALTAHPVEVALSILYFVFSIFTLYAEYDHLRMWGTVIVFFPVVFAISYAFNHLFTEKPRSEYYVTLLLVVPLFVFHKELGEVVDSVAYPVTLLLAVLLMLGFRRAPDNTAFARQSLQMGVDFALAGLISALLMGAVMAIDASVHSLFDWRGWRECQPIAVFFIGFVVLPLTFCYLQDRSYRRELRELPRIWQVILNFILSPAIIVYTLILYAYTLTIALRWELPKGGIALMVMAFVVAGIVGRMAQLLVGRRYFDWFYRHFTYIAILPLVLFWVGTLHRVLEYGLTEMRVYLLLAGVLATLFVAFLPFRRLGRYRLMLAISAAALVLLTYIPGMRARDIGNWSQERRTERQEVTDADAPADSVGPSFSSLEFRTLIPLEGYRFAVPDCTFSQFNDTLTITSPDGVVLLNESAADHFARYKAMLDTCRDYYVSDVRPFSVTNDSCMAIVQDIVHIGDGSYRFMNYGNFYVFLK
jgi:hypothetical protein